MPESSGANPFAALVTDRIPDLHVNGDAQCFPLYYYEKAKSSAGSLFDGEVKQQYTRRDGINDFIYKKAQASYGSAVTKEDIFYYVYGFLHSPSYRETFANDLRKSLPRLPKNTASITRSRPRNSSGGTAPNCTQIRLL